MLKVEDLNVFYGDIQVLHEVSIEVREGEIVVILGVNAAGKTTLLNTIAGLTKKWNGTMTWMGQPLQRVPAFRRVEMGIVLVPEGRQLFPFMTVLENLELGAYSKAARREKERSLEFVFQLLPKLYERRHQLAGSLSGGEQQMVAIGRGLMAKPKLLMLDEPTLGLAPKIVNDVFQLIQDIRKSGVTILLVEQNMHQSLQVADRGYVLENGRVTISGSSEALLRNPTIREAYLGI
ncbi:ABC transporter ATP-binding protein [Hydrogenibacillus sp. N12]|uniref:ABC transporter ATP-binding protein n=1 Tax=Hydrogenibacillus sp. N12 TaxID=2866627 RepID=UPI001C7DD481|nr:ABC transporter ATP-binding protein [Hydrogenibacillus sp. N12]QZA32881.1 ABC transporter ATP-binding protein [Hydrogenibacillus sp. N12]